LANLLSLESICGQCPVRGPVSSRSPASSRNPVSSGFPSPLGVRCRISLELAGRPEPTSAQGRGRCWTSIVGAVPIAHPPLEQKINYPVGDGAIPVARAQHAFSIRNISPTADSRVTKSKRAHFSTDKNARQMSHSFVRQNRMINSQQTFSVRSTGHTADSGSVKHKNTHTFHPGQGRLTNVPSLR
jgi:hypothetical protein